VQAKVTEAAIQELFGEVNGIKGVVNVKHEDYPPKYRFDNSEENHLNAAFILIRGQSIAASWTSADFRPKTLGEHKIDKATLDDWNIQINAKETADENKILKRKLERTEARSSKRKLLLHEYNTDVSDTSEGSEADS